MTEYRLDNRLTGLHTIALVGCGGTGSFAAEGLCRLLLGYPGMPLVLVDGDRVEERNLGRQNFYPEDLGHPKAQALAERLARKYRRRVAYTATALNDLNARDVLAWAHLVVACVDNAQARSTIAQAMETSRWWVDAGNGNEHGQVLVGNAAIKRLRGAFNQEKGVCHLLPLPSLVRPELVIPPARPREISCAAAVAVGDQGPTINQLMAGLVVEVIRRLLEGRLRWWQVYLDLESGSMHTVCPTPELVSRLTGVSVRELTRR